jgi:peptidoglycan-associated lipoprotein
MMIMMSMRGARIAVALTSMLALAACSNKNATGPGLANGAGGGLGGAGGIAAPGTPQDFVVNVGDRVFFEEDHSDLSGTAQATLTKQAQWLRTYPAFTVTIEGHADERGTREYNIALGARRAQATRDYLVSQGIPTQRMRTISYGKERPVAVCNDASCWTQNRRAVTVLNGGSS